MAYQVLARKYRPQRFADVAGQEHVTRTLLNALEQGRTAHGYIFSGHRGIGKTTIARILAMSLNCRSRIGSPERPSPEPCGVCVSCQEIRAGNSVDLLEIDAATNRGIDEVRELREAARYKPARDRYKIYLLDEAHQITDAAFNALLKTLEEPPDHIVFMMATTQPEDIPQTIRSRCQHFSFHAVSFEDILSELRQIAQKETILADDAALALLAEAGDGSMRDALSIMDQAIASAPAVGPDRQPRLEAEQIRDLMGAVPNTVLERIFEQICGGESAAVMHEINRLLNIGNSPSHLARQLVRYLRNCLMAKIGGQSTALLQVSDDERGRAARSAALFSEEDLTRFLQIMLRTFDELNYRQEQRFHLELGLLKLVHLERLLPLEQILSNLPGVGGPQAASPAGPANAPIRGVQARIPPSPLPARPLPEASSGPGVTSPIFPSSRSASSGSPRAEAAANSDVEHSGPSRTAENDLHALAASSAFPPPSNAGHAPLSLAGMMGEQREDHSAKSQQIPDLEVQRARDAIVNALAGKGHATAAALLSAANWSGSNGVLRAEAGVKKTMLSLAMTPDAQRIAAEILRAEGIAAKLDVVPAETTAGTTASSLPTVPSGSMHKAALEHPLVRQAQEIFRAEIRSVLDLRESSGQGSREKG